MCSLNFAGRAALALLSVFSCATFALAQGGPASLEAPEAYKILAARRMEMSKRAVDETLRRRFEEGKPTQSFPSDALKREAGKPGVVRVVSPEERRALEHNEKGLSLFSKGKLEQAVKEYNEAIRAYPALAAAHNNLGSAHFAAGRFGEAAAAFRRACEIDPGYGQAYFNLALVHIKLGREREAQEALTAAARAYHAAGEAHLKAGRLKEAEESFRAILQIDPDYAPALLRLGLVCNAARRFEEGARHLRHAAERRPTDPDAHEALAESLYNLRRYDEAASSADRALKLAPDARGAHYLAGLARASLGQRDAALAHLDKLKQLTSPDYAKDLSDFIDKKSPAKQ